jgi:uncharacterized membrane protein YhhN
VALYRQEMWSILSWKTMTSLGFCTVGWLRYGRSSRNDVDIFFLVALGFSLLGDIFLTLEGDTFFLPGVGAFVITHVLYLVAFLKINGFKMQRLNIAGAILVFIGLIPVLFFAGLKYGEMFPAIIGYSVIISLMTGNSLSVIRVPKYEKVGQWLIIGSFLFVISDVVLVCYLFAPQQVMGWQAMNWVLYYVAQFMFAFSIAGVEVQ